MKDELWMFGFVPEVCQNRCNVVFDAMIIDAKWACGCYVFVNNVM